MKVILLSCVVIVLLFSGCFRKMDHFNTLKDYSDVFGRLQKVSLKGRKQLSVSDAGKIAIANNPTLRAAANAIRSAQYGYYRSLSAWAPEISAAGTVAGSKARGYDLHHPPAGIFPSEERFDTSVSVKATWLLFNGLARELDILIADLEYDKSIAASDDVKRLLLRAVAYIWCDILLASEEIVIFRADKAFQDAALKQAAQQFKSGHVAYSAVLNFKILSASAQSRIILAEYNRQTALNTLAALLGCGSGELPADMELLPISQAPVELYHSPDFYLELAIRNRPDLKVEKLLYEKAIRKKQSAYAAFMPELHLFADFSFGSAAAVYGGYPVKSSYYNHPAFVYGLTGTWNVFRGLDSLNELRRQKALEQIALWGLNKKYLDVIAEVEDALENCRNTQAQIDIFREMTGWVLEQRELIYSEYINGRETIARVNQAQSALVEARSNLALWKIQYHKAAAQLQAALGTDAAEWLKL